MGHCSFFSYLRIIALSKPIGLQLLHTLRGKTALGDLVSGPGQGPRHQSLVLEMMDCQDVGDHHDHHGDVEREQGAKDEEVLVVHLAHGARGHDVLHVQEGEDGDGGGEEEPQAPGERHLVEDAVLPLGPLPQRPPDASIPT